jgi:oligopeptide transport system substrate-binding protein
MMMQSTTRRTDHGKPERAIAFGKVVCCERFACETWVMSIKQTPTQIMRALLFFFAVITTAEAFDLTTLERGNGPEPDSLDPQRGQSLSAQNILRDLFEGLTREDARGTVIPGIAERWQTSGDGLTWTFYLRKDAKFSDGTRIVAPDFVASFSRALDPKTAAAYATQLLVFTGASARLKGRAGPLGVQVIDAHTLQITLTQITPNLAARLSLPVAAVVPTALIARVGNLWTRAENVVTSGAYTVSQWRPLANITLVKNTHYYDAALVALPKVRYHVTEDASEEARRFDAAELHITETIPPGRVAQLRARFGSKLRIAPSLGSFFLGLNLTQPPLAGNLALRQALSLAIDRTRIVEIITGTGEEPAFGLLPRTLTGAPPPPVVARRQNEARARALYRHAGYSTLVPLTIELRYNTSLLNRRLMLAISVMWEQVLGVQTVLRQEEMKVLVQNRRARRITQAFRGGWNADLADPLDFLDIFSADSTLNTTGFQSPKFTALLARLHQTTDVQQGRDLALQAEAELLAAQPIIPLFFYTSKHLVTPELDGFVENPLDHHASRLLRWRMP